MISIIEEHNIALESTMKCKISITTNRQHKEVLESFWHFRNRKA